MLCVHAEFMGVCGSRQLDVWRYGWQKRQETARCGKVGGKNGKDVGRRWGIQVCVAAGARGWGGHVWASWAVVQVWAARGGI